MNRVLLALLALVFVAARVLPAAVAPKATVRLQGTISAEVAKAQSLGRLEQKELLEFSITLPVRKQAELDDYLKHLYTPGDPLFHKFLNTGEFAELYGPTPEQYEAVVAFAEGAGLKVVARHANRLVLEVAGTADTVEKAFDIHMNRFQSASGRTFHAPDQEPALPSTIAPLIAGIVDLDKSPEPKSNFIVSPTAPAKDSEGGSFGVSEWPCLGIRSFRHYKSL